MFLKRPGSPIRMARGLAFPLPTMTAMASPMFLSPTTPSSVSSTITMATALSAKSDFSPVSATTRMAKTFAGMGIDFSDYDNDGLPDIVVTDLSNERYMLFRNEGAGTFRDVTNASGIGSASLAFSGWSTHLFDYDNDAWKDLFVAQSHVMDTIEKTSPNLRYLEPPLLLRNLFGTFCPGRRWRGFPERLGRVVAPLLATSTMMATPILSPAISGKKHTC